MNTKPLHSQKLTQVQTLIKLLSFSSFFNLNPSARPYKNLWKDQRTEPRKIYTKHQALSTRTHCQNFANKYLHHMINSPALKQRNQNFSSSYYYCSFSLFWFCSKKLTTLASALNRTLFACNFGLIARFCCAICASCWCPLD